MSFDLVLVAFDQGENSIGDAEAARAVLERAAYRHAPEFSWYTVSFPDGSHVELSASGLSDDAPFRGGTFALRGCTPAITDFVFEFTHAASMVIIPTMSEACVLIPRPDLARHVPDDLGHEFARIPIDSGDALLNVIAGGFDEWSAYRDQVVGG